MIARWLGLLLGVALALGAPAEARHTVFHFTVDRFEVDGSHFGSFDGSPDWIDEFNDSVEFPWFTPYGTSSKSGGRLHVQSPGTHFPGPDGTTLDLTEVVCVYTVSKGQGDFSATAVFDPIVPPEGHFYHFTVFTFGGGLYFNELFGIDIHTSGGETRIEQHLVELDLTNAVYATLQTDGRTINPADITGQLHFRVTYDDAAGTITSAFSLDGGATFASPFAAAPIFTQGRTSAEFILGADPRIASTSGSTSTTSTSTTSTITSPGAPTTTTLPLGSCQRTSCAEASESRLDLRVRPNGRTLAWSWRRGASRRTAMFGEPDEVLGSRYALCVRDGAGTLLFRDELRPGGSCGGRSCWRLVGANGYAYRDPRAEHGATSIRLTSFGRAGSHASALARGSALFGALPSALPLTVQLEVETGACWSSTFAVKDVVIGGPRRLTAVRRTGGRGGHGRRRGF